MQPSISGVTNLLKEDAVQQRGDGPARLARQRRLQINVEFGRLWRDWGRHIRLVPRLALRTINLKKTAQYRNRGEKSEA